MSLIPLDKTSGEWVILFEFVVTGRLVVTEHTGDGEVLRSGIENYSCWLSVWRSHMNCTKINCIVSTIKGHLKLQVILVVLRSICNFADKLGDVSMCPTALLSLLTSLNIVTII